MNYLIGCGGVGSWLAPALCLLEKPKHVTLIDRDTLEPGNMNRQLFRPEEVGRNKAEALAQKYGCLHRKDWFSFGLLQIESSDVLVVCADNNPARLAALNEADRSGARVIVAANEKHSSEAYFYSPAWKGTRLDPRQYYPSLLTDHADDPRAAAIGCTGEAQQRTVQLVTSNASAAALSGHLFVLWILEQPKLDNSVIPFLPYLLRCNLTKLETLTCGVLEERTISHE